MDEVTQSTDVGNDSPVAIAPESNGADASSVVTSGEENQATASGDGTAQLGSEGETVEQVESADSASEADPLEGVPGLDELEQNINQPYAKALKQLRSAYEARKEEINGLKPLEQFKDITTLGEPETIKQVVETHKLLFTPVVNPTTQQVERDEYGFEKTTTTPFIEKMDGDNPGIAEQMLNDLLRYTPDRDGQKIPLWQSMLRDGFGLDPARLDDYKNIDALTAAQPTGEITSEELDQIPSELQEAFKSLPPGVRQDLLAQDEETRKFNLEAHKERFDNRTAAQQRQQQEAQAQQAQQAQLLEQVRSEQESFVSQQLQQGLATIMDDVAQKITFSTDAAENSKMLGIVEAFIFATRDPDYKPFIEKTLNAFGAKLDPSFHEALTAADKHFRDAKALELFGQKGRAQGSLVEANKAKTRVLAKLAPLAVMVAKALGGQQANKAAQQNGLLAATATRATPPNGGSVSESGGYLPAGMRANSPEADVYLARQTGLLR